MITDKLFLLSLWEVDNILSSENIQSDDESILYMHNGEEWWTRSNHIIETNNNHSQLHFGYLCCDENVGVVAAVRPAIHIKPDSLTTLKHTSKGNVVLGNREWIVLDYESGLIISKEAICEHHFDSKISCLYEESEIRAFLNNTLINSLFTDEEQEMIVDTVIDGIASYPSKTEIDKLFLLSDSEVEKYLSSPKNKMRRLPQSFFQSSMKQFWWLRSARKYCNFVASVNCNGTMYSLGDSVDTDFGLVRPALYLNIDYLQTLKRTWRGYIKFGGRKWMVIDEKTGLLLCKKTVCKHRFDEVLQNYIISEIRTFMNKELLYEMFSKEERKMIMDTVIDGGTSYPAI